MAATGNIPQHVAIIMDGNGRWAQERGLLRVQGHQQGVETIREIIQAARELKIRFLTLYAFSKENWARPRPEVDFLMKLLSQYLDSELQELEKGGVKFNVIGRIDQLPKEIQEKIKRNIKQSEHNRDLVLTLALNYSSRIEITDAARCLCESVKAGRLEVSEIDESHLAKALYTRDMPDPDLLIRTSGELRISNFLLWQISYSEIYVSEKYWPDFKREDFLKAIQEYQKRERRFGRTEAIQADHD
ncbi:MAG: isoprenyl transferase [Candidatus Omnitrophica bacterium]|nr:isoprenyl transferase [Candidatus Omnitrophota bacterium]